MNLLSRFFGAHADDARAEALRRGVIVEDVEREVLIFDRRNRFERLQVTSCVRYALPRRSGSRPTRWSFLQRDAAPGAPFPNGWQLQLAGETLPGQLRAVLAHIAAEWTEELLEFEADEHCVSAYWEEWGGAKQAAVMAGYLEQLAKA